MSSYTGTGMSSSAKILEDVKNGKCSIEEAQTLLAQLTVTERKKVTYKVSPKGAISFYGIRRMPITVYLQELEQITNITKTDEFQKFVAENSDKLSTKAVTTS
jgi:hypothetical protein